MAKIEPIQPRLRVEVLSADQVAEIRAATLHILETVGVHFPSKSALKVFAEHGARVDPKSQIVKLSPDLVLEAISRAPRTYTLSGRAAGTDLVLNGWSSCFSTDDSGTKTFDWRTIGVSRLWPVLLVWIAQSLPPGSWVGRPFPRPETYPPNYSGYLDTRTHSPTPDDGSSAFTRYPRTCQRKFRENFIGTST